MTPPAYGRAFAADSNEPWRACAENSAPRLLAWYAAPAPGRQGLPVLDLGCGTGQLARHFVAAGYAVTGLDLSADMLAHAEANNAAAVAASRARFVQGDAARFALDERFGLVVSTFDALNHLPSLDALRSCFHSARAVLAPGGWFVFDLNTRLGLKGWNGVSVHEHTKSKAVRLVTGGPHLLGGHRRSAAVADARGREELDDVGAARLELPHALADLGRIAAALAQRT